ncbi:MAG: ABC transporter permease [Acidobacteria bacterium]|nr:ABC transporter permease [Acidobacteriota bacterium]
MGSAVAKIRSAVGGIIPGRREIGGGSSTSGSKGMAFAARYGTIVFLLVLVVAFTILCEIRLGEQRFLSGNNLTLLLRQSAVLAILASGLTIALILGEFDLSIAAALTLGGGIFALFLSGQYVVTWPTIPFTDIGGGAVVPADWQDTFLFAFVAAAFFGLLAGLINGIVVSYFGVSAFIGTLGLAGIIEGYLIRLTDGRSVALPKNVTDTAQGTLFGWKAPESWGWDVSVGGRTFNLDLGGLSLPIIAVTAAVILFGISFFLRQTEAGRRMDAVGGNPEASRLAGIDVKRYRLAAFMMCAVIAAIAGVVLAAGRTGSAVTLVGNQGSYLLQAYTACFLGAVTLREGEFHVLGTAIGVLLMTVTFSGLIILGVPGYAQTIANGVILIAALTFAGLARRAARRT